MTRRLLALLFGLALLWIWSSRHGGSLASGPLGGVLTRARLQGRVALVQFECASRPLCRALREETLAAESVRRALDEGFAYERIDAEHEQALFEGLLGEGGVLATVVLDPRGAPLAALRGFVTAEEYLEFLTRARAAAPAWVAEERAAAAADARPESWLAHARGLGQRGLAWRSLELCARVEGCASAPPSLRGEAALLAARLHAERGDLQDGRAALERARATGSCAPAALAQLERALAIGRED